MIKLRTIGVSLAAAVAVALIGGFIVTQRGDSTMTYSSGAPIAYGLLQSNYGLLFTPASGEAASYKVSQQNAIHIGMSVLNSSISQSQVDATFGYLSTEPNGNTTLVPPSASAYQQGHGQVTKYPVWLVRVTGLSIQAHGPANSANKIQPNTSLYQFIDANNGQLFFGVAMP